MMPIHDAGDFQDLCQLLSSNDSEVDIVSLTKFGEGNGYFIRDRDSVSLAQCLAENTVVTEIYINITKLSVRGGIALMPFLISSSKLQILGLQGNCDPEEEDLDTQMIVADVLIRAAIRNMGHLTVDLDNCPIARSTLMTTIQSASQLSDISISGGRLIVDNEDPIFHELAYSTDLREINIVQDVFNIDLSQFLMNCFIHLPRVETIFFNGNLGLPLELAQKRSLEKLSYFNRYDPCEAAALESIAAFIEHADRLSHIYLHLLDLDGIQQQNICRAFRRNRSLIYVWQSPPISDALAGYCQRNKDFLEHWQDLAIRIPPTVFAFAAAVATHSSAGRTTLFERLPLLITKAS
eukprot:scaffold2294_cov106-Cylindrotheca_fusiformis.AAC.14